MKLCPACRRTYPPGRGGEVPYLCPHCGSLSLGPYRDLAYLGGGGMGDVYRARDPDMGDRTVAIKIPKTEVDAKQIQRRFEREIAASARLEHENSVRAYHRGQEEGRPYLVMEFVEGRKLSEVVQQEHPLAPRRVAKIILGVARGLAHAERKGVINRDVKPDNIFLAEPGETPKLLDYGLALIPGAEDQVTRYGSLLGTPSYVAPEQAADPHSVTIAADVYSLGCTAFFCLTGHPPFIAADIAGICRQHATAPRPSVCDERPDVTDDFDAILRRMMAPEPGDRPTAGRVIETLERLMPQLSDQVPSLPREISGRLMDVVCPACGERFHLPPASIGKSFRCTNKLCREVFLAVPEAETADSAPIPWPAGETAAILDAHIDAPTEPTRSLSHPADAEALVEIRPAIAVPDEVPRAEPFLGDDAEVEILPMEAIVGETPHAPDTADTMADSAAAGVVDRRGRQRRREPKVRPEAKPRRERKSGRQRRISRAKWLAAGLLLLLLASSWLIARYWVPERAWGPDPAARLAEIKDDYDYKKWSQLERKIEKFREDFPNEQPAELPFFLDMSRAGPDIYSTTGNIERGLDCLQEVFKNHRDSPVYQQYCVDIYQALDVVLETLVKQGQDLADSAKLDLAAEAYDLLKTVGRQLQEPWVADNTGKWSSRLAQAEQTVAVARTRTRLVESLESLLADPQSSLDPDAVYATAERSLSQYPELQQDSELTSLIDRAYGAEPARVRFQRDEPDAGAVPEELVARDRQRQGTTLVIALGDAPATAGEPGRLVYALARGILYVFDTGGELRWARRLGVDTSSLPSQLRPGGVSGGLAGRAAPVDASVESLIAVNSEENLLLALDPASGQVRWQYRVGADIVAPPTLIPRQPDPNVPPRLCGLLPTAEGEIHVLELARGRRLGHYLIGQPMILGGTYDPATGLVLFPADRKRVFAVNPAAIDDAGAAACVSILHTGHPAGALRAGPIVVGQYLILAEVSELEHTRLRVFELRAAGFSAPKAKPLKELTLKGWFWFPPNATPDRITLVTDQGDLGVFGLNLDNVDEALYPIIQTAPQEPAVNLHVQDASRTMAVHTEEHLVWVMAGGRLQKLAIDVLGQKIHSLWPAQGQDFADSGLRGSKHAPRAVADGTRSVPATFLSVTGVPVHEPIVDPNERTFYLTTMSPRGGVYQFTSVNCDSGAVNWRRQLGVSLLGDPVVFGDQIALIDRSGGVVYLRPRTYADFDQPRILQLPEYGRPPEEADESLLIRLGEPPGPIHLVLPTAGGTALAVRTLRLGEAPQPAWNVVPLPVPLYGQPCVCGDWLVVPGADGTLYRVRLDGGRGPENMVNFDWASVKPPGPNRGDVYRLGPDSVLLIDGGRRVRRLTLRREESVTRWKEEGQGFCLPSPMHGRPLIDGDRLFLFDASGTLFELDPRDPNRQIHRWPTGLNVTGGPFMRGGRLMAIVDHARLACLDMDAEPATAQPVWITAAFRGWIRGLPVLADGVLLVADSSQAITGVRLHDGSEAWKVPLGGHLAPSAAPVPYGKDRILVPLADGTLVVCKIPEPQAAEKSP